MNYKKYISDSEKFTSHYVRYLTYFVHTSKLDVFKKYMPAIRVMFLLLFLK